MSQRYQIYRNTSWSKARESYNVIEMDKKKESLNIDSYEIEKIEGTNDENTGIDKALMNIEDHIVDLDYTYN